MYVPRTRAELRDLLLTNLAAEDTAIGETLLVTPGSSAYLWASALAAVLEGNEAQAQQVDRDILPDQASPEALARHGYTYRIARDPGVKAVLSNTVTGTPSATITVPAGTVLTYSDGTRYVATDASVTLNGGGSGTLTMQAEDYGVAGTREVGDVVSFVSAPAGLNTSTTVASVTVEGADADSDEAYAQKILDYLQERPGAGNRADWAAWCDAYRGNGTVVQSLVYPLLEAPDPYVAGTPGTAGVAGYVTVLCVGEAQGDSVTNTRLLGQSAGARLTLSTMAYIEGAVDADGTVVSNGVQLRPVTIPIGNYSVEVPYTQTQNVVVQCTMNAANAFPFSATPTIHADSTTTSIVVTGDYSASGTDLSGESALVNFGTGVYRGGYGQVTLETGTYNGGTGRTTFPVATMIAEPTGTLYPAPANWTAIRAGVFDFFDALGPGDTTTISFAPTPTVQSTSTSTSIVVAGDYSVSGTNLSGLAALVSVGTINDVQTTLGVGVYAAPNTTFPVSALGGTPVAGSLLRGVVTGTAYRWPAPENTDGGFPSALYPSALARVVLNADNGVLSASSTTPSVAVYPAQKTMIVLGTLLVTA